MFSKRSRDIILFWGFGASGGAALIYEVVWERALASTIGGTVYSLSILLAAFMAGLALGGHVGGSRFINQKDHVKIFGCMQLSIGLAGVATYFIINNLQSLYAIMWYGLRGNFTAFTLAQMAAVFAVLLLPATLMGICLPVVMEAWSLRVREVGAMAGDVYSVNTWGAVLGSLAAGLLLIPLVGLRMANLTAAGINFSVALICFSIINSRRLISLLAVTLLVAAPIGIIKTHFGIRFGFANADHFESYEAFKAETASLKTLYEKEGAYGRVQVFEVVDGEPARMLVSGGRFEGSTGNDALSMRILAHLPLAIHEKADSMLNIGLGTGTTLKVAAADGRLKDIDVVEINPLVNEAVDKYFYPGILKDPRVDEIVDDARHYLAYADRKYDIIISQPSYPTRKSVSHLFTKEFYDIVAERLNADGLYVQWLPRYLLKDNDVRTAIKTLRSTFPNTNVWDYQNTDIYLIASQVPRVIDPARVDAKIKAIEPNIRGWHYAGGPARMDELTSDPSISINTDDLPHIEFAAARNKVTGVKGVTAR